MPSHRASDDRPTDPQRACFSFEATELRQAVDAATELRRVTPNRVRVRPALLEQTGSYRWRIDVTTGALDVTAVAALEEELRWVARRGRGIRFTGWLYPARPVDPPAGEPAASARPPTRVLIVDDSAPFRRAARDLLEHRGFRVVGEADTVASGLAAVERLKPDALLLDIRLPDGSGIDLCELLALERDAPAVLLVSSDTVTDGAIGKAHGARAVASKADLPLIDFRDIWEAGG